jgi:hypothetical protein
LSVVQGGLHYASGALKTGRAVILAQDGGRRQLVGLTRREIMLKALMRGGLRDTKLA